MSDNFTIVLDMYLQVIDNHNNAIDQLQEEYDILENSTQSSNNMIKDLGRLYKDLEKIKKLEHTAYGFYLRNQNNVPEESQDKLNTIKNTHLRVLNFMKNIENKIMKINPHISLMQLSTEYVPRSFQ